MNGPWPIYYPGQVRPDKRKVHPGLAFGPFNNELDNTKNNNLKRKNKKFNRSESLLFENNNKNNNLKVNLNFKNEKETKILKIELN